MTLPFPLGEQKKKIIKYKEPLNFDEEKASSLIEKSGKGYEKAVLRKRYPNNQQMTLKCPEVRKMQIQITMKCDFMSDC